MVRTIILLYFCTFLPNATKGFFAQFIHGDTGPKCCKPQEVLSVISASTGLPFECARNVNKTTHILSGEFLPEFVTNGSDPSPCIDVLVDEENEIRDVVKIETSDPQVRITHLKLDYFPKCCPVGSFYNTLEHKCASGDGGNETENYTDFADEFLGPHLGDGVFLIKPGLFECNSVVLDYVAPYFDRRAFGKNKEYFVDDLEDSIGYGSYCVDKVYNSENYVVRVCHSNLDACKKSAEDSEKIKCVRKCCGDGWMFKGGAKCRPDFEHGLDLQSYPNTMKPLEPFAIIEGQNCRKYLSPPDWDFSIDEMGRIILHLEESNKTASPLDDHGYCLEHVDLGLKKGHKLFLCFEIESPDNDFLVSKIALTLSCIFLIFTLAVYGFLPEMQNLHGKTLMCHCATLLVAFAALALVQFYPTIGATYVCQTVGYFIMYSFLAAFMWSNIMCFDIWWTFGSMRVQGIIYKQKELRRLLWYCTYSWGVPIIITLVTFLIQKFAEYMPDSMQPFVPTLGGFSCFFEEQTNTTAFLTWFILPIAIISICNIVLFIKTIAYCYKVKNEIAKMKDSQLNKKERKKILNTDTERLKVVFKLFLVMGIPWIFEIISVLTIPVVPSTPAKIVETIFDTVNCLQGVFIFCIFILKAKFIHALKKAFGFKEKLRRSSQSTTAVTQSTYITPQHKV